MEALKRARRPVRREFDTYLKELEKLLKQTPLNTDEINVKFKLFTDVYESLHSQDATIIQQLTADGATEVEENQEWDEIKEFHVKAETLRQQVDKLIDNHPYNKTTHSVAGCSTTSEAKVRNFKLPPVQLKKFSGKVEDWLGFWAQFENIHEDQQLSDNDKFYYLLQSLEAGTDAHMIVSGYHPSNENYKKVIEALKKQFGSEDLQLQVYIREILSLVISNVNAKEKLPMKTLFLKLDSHLRALKTLNLEKADPATWLFPLVESCLPEQMLYQWNHSPLSKLDGSTEEPPRNRLDILMSYIEREVEIRQSMDLTRKFANQHRVESNERRSFPKEKRFEKRVNVPTISSFHNCDKKLCAFCDRTKHETAECFQAKRMSYEAKMKILREKRLCFRCAGSHIASSCPITNLSCEICQRKHLPVLCKGFRSGEERSWSSVVAPKGRDSIPVMSGNRIGEASGSRSSNPKRKFASEGQVDVRSPNFKRPAIEKETFPVRNATSSSANVECTSEIALQTLLVRVNSGGCSRIIRAFIDSGSQRSYILKSTASAMELTPTGIEEVVHSLFGGNRTATTIHQKYQIELSSIHHDYTKSFEVRDSEKICGILPTITCTYPDIVKELQMKNVTLTDCDANKKEVELLIGADVYATIVTGRIEKLNRGAAAVHTELGWTLLGNVADERRESIAYMCLSMSTQDANIARLWELETIGVEDPSKEKSEKKLEEMEIQKFISNITREEDGRYSVKLPWKNNLQLLPSNRPVAFKRLESASKKLLDTKMFAAYHSIFVDWEKEGFIERVSINCDSEVIHYLPHRPVIKDSMTTPVRPVFDASCRVGKSPSLNDCLFTGESKVKAIPDLILRFREKTVAFVSDIRKAFQMIGVNEEDRDAMRFLWWNNEEMKNLVEYRHVRVMFGATCSPFILEAVLYHHLTNCPEEKREIGKKLLSTLYVDNCVSSEDTIEEYLCFRRDATELLRSAKMDLRMWLSNVDEFEDPATCVVSVLGLQWDRMKDELFVPVKKIPVPIKITKRSVLSAVQKVFDPIGFTCPALLPMKLLLQRAWIHKMKWDEDLPEAERRTFVKWCEEVGELEEIRLPRLSTAGVSDRRRWSLHTFRDASKDAYAAVVFLRIKTENYTEVQLLAAKSRVAPIKQMTIPKLELMGCLIGKRLADTVKKAMKIEDVEEYFWSDSTTALAWIRRDPDLWGTFVSNRAKEIRESTNIEKWRHVPGVNNPADLPSRGCLPSKLLLSRWWSGPKWLYESEENWPKQNEEVDEKEVLDEQRKSVKVRAETSCISLLEAVQVKYSFSKQIRILGWVRRFLHNWFVKNPELRKRGPLKKSELIRAEIILVRDIQKKNFPKEERNKLIGLEIIEDNWGLLRVKTRLTYRDDPINFRYPMLLPRTGEIVEQLIRETHQNYCHAGVGFLVTKLRQKYWILKARHTVKKVVSKCVRCRRYSAKSVVPDAAPLPLDRVKDAEVFEVTGVDLAGPLILKNGKKVWMVVFTCAVYRAVHFELVSAISTTAFLMSLERFVEKFRRPSIIYSDNGTNFRGADNLFKKIDWTTIEKQEQTSQIIWKFNPPTSSWWGGWWERLIRTAKDLLRRTVGKQSLSMNELKDVMRSVAEVMNGRPLTYVSENPLDLEPLTPALFLHPLGNVNFPEREASEPERLRFRHKYVQTLKEELKNRFLKEYLSMLVNRKPKKVTRGLTIGELVLVGCDNLKRIEWPLGRVIELIPGRDGVVRVARVKTARGEMTRSVQRLFPLEMDTEAATEVMIQAEEATTRCGRKIQKPLRYV